MRKRQIMEFDTKKKHALLDHLTEKLGLKNDRQLSNYFDVYQPVLSKIRHGKLPVSGNFILLIHEKTGMPYLT